MWILYVSEEQRRSTQLTVLHLTTTAGHVTQLHSMQSKHGSQECRRARLTFFLPRCSDQTHTHTHTVKLIPLSVTEYNPDTDPAHACVINLYILAEWLIFLHYYIWQMNVPQRINTAGAGPPLFKCCSALYPLNNKVKRLDWVSVCQNDKKDLAVSKKCKNISIEEFCVGDLNVPLY